MLLAGDRVQQQRHGAPLLGQPLIAVVQLLDREAETPPAGAGRPEHVLGGVERDSPVGAQRVETSRLLHGRTQSAVPPRPGRRSGGESPAAISAMSRATSTSAGQPTVQGAGAYGPPHSRQRSASSGASAASSGGHGSENDVSAVRVALMASVFAFVVPTASAPARNAGAGKRAPPSAAADRDGQEACGFPDPGYGLTPMPPHAPAAISVSKALNATERR